MCIVKCLFHLSLLKNLENFKSAHSFIHVSFVFMHFTVPFREVVVLLQISYSSKHLLLQLFPPPFDFSPSFLLIGICIVVSVSILRKWTIKTLFKNNNPNTNKCNFMLSIKPNMAIIFALFLNRVQIVTIYSSICREFCILCRTLVIGGKTSFSMIGITLRFYFRQRIFYMVSKYLIFPLLMNCLENWKNVKWRSQNFQWGAGIFWKSYDILMTY